MPKMLTPSSDADMSSSADVSLRKHFHVIVAAQCTVEMASLETRHQGSAD